MKMALYLKPSLRKESKKRKQRKIKLGQRRCIAVGKRVSRNLSYIRQKDVTLVGGSKDAKCCYNHTAMYLILYKS
jgi:hypothetical protein